MWSSDDEGDDDLGGPNAKSDLSKVDLVNGIIKAVRGNSNETTDNQRKQVAALESPSLQHSSADVPQTPRESGSSPLTSPPSSSGDSQLIKDMEVEATPKAPARAKNRHRQQPGTANRKERKLKITIRPKGTERRDVRKARFDNTLKSPEQKVARLRRTRSSTVSSQYATTSDGSNNPSHELNLRKPRHPSRRPAPSAAGVERTPMIRRLRPRTRGSASSNGSTEVDADQEDNADDESVSAGSSRQLRRPDSASTRATHDRRAKQEALRSMQPDDTSSDEDTGKRSMEICERRPLALC